jgi:hypothetical protein
MTDAIEFEHRRECGVFTDCDSIPELIAVARSFLGIDAVRQLVEAAHSSREDLAKWAGLFRRLGLLDVADVLKKAAKRARPRPVSGFPGSRAWKEDRRRRGLPLTATNAELAARYQTKH